MTLHDAAKIDDGFLPGFHQLPWRSGLNLVGDNQFKATHYDCKPVIADFRQCICRAVVMWISEGGGVGNHNGSAVKARTRGKGFVVILLQCIICTILLPVMSGGVAEHSVVSRSQVETIYNQTEVREDRESISPALSTGVGDY